MRCTTALLLLTAAALPLSAQSSSPASPSAGPASLTIYQDGRVLVRRALPVGIPRGGSTVHALLGDLQPATLFATDSGTFLTGYQYDASVDAGSALRRAVGRPLRFAVPPVGDRPADTVTATILRVDPLQVKLPDGSISFELPGRPLFPPELVPTDPSVALSVQSVARRDTLRLGYFTQGAQWEADYEVVLGRSTALVSGKAAITSSGLQATDAQIQLLAGQVNRAGPSGGMVMQNSVARKAMAAPNAFESASEQRVGEFHLYSVPGRLTLTPGTTTAAALFDPTSGPYQRRYIVPGDVPYYGPLNQHPGDENDVPVDVNYVLSRKRGTDFGDRPLPGGVARIYQADSSGRLQLIGESSLDHTPAGQELRLDAGTAFDLTARRTQTDFRTARDSSGGRWWTVATAAYRVTLSNATDTAATVEVREERYGEWKVTSSSVPAHKVSSTLTRFLVTVPARGDAVLRYTVQARW